MGWRRRWPAAVLPCVVLTVGWAHTAESKAVPGSQRAALPWNEINVVAVTDVHGWVNGHRHPDNTPRLDADYGDLISFRHHIEAEAEARRRDVLYVNSGDLVDGRGISDATDPKGKVFFKLLQQVPFDAYGIGNHELYESSTARELVDSGFVKWLDGGYITSNVVWSSGVEAGSPIGSRYKIWTGKRSGVKVLILGFLYDFTGAADGVTVVPVAKALQEPWLESALREELFDAVVVLAHMDLKDTLVSEIVNRIRTSLPVIPVQVLCGHTHYRGFTKVDDNAAALESGKYFDTVGWVSFAGAVLSPTNTSATPRRLANDVTPARDTTAAETTWYDFEYLDATRDALATAVGVDPVDFPTTAGDLFRGEVELARAALGLDRQIGCSPQDFSRTAEFAESASAYGLMMREVNPTTLFLPSRNMSMVSLQSVGSLRYNVYEGIMTVDDTITVSPFGDPYFRLAVLSASQINDCIAELGKSKGANDSTQPEVDVLGTWVHSAYDTLGGLTTFDLIVPEYDLESVLAALKKTSGVDWDVAMYRHGEIDTTNVWEEYITTHWQSCRNVISPAVL